MCDADDWSWVTSRRQRKKKRVLAGFARATGDRALTASIHDLVVLPELQGLGLGRKLLAKATNQVTGFIANAPLQPSPCYTVALLQSGLKMPFSMCFATGKPGACHAICRCTHHCTDTPDFLIPHTCGASDTKGCCTYALV